MSICKDNIIWLDIGVNDVVSMQGMNRTQELGGQGSG